MIDFRDGGGMDRWKDVGLIDQNDGGVWKWWIARYVCVCGGGRVGD